MNRFRNSINNELDDLQVSEELKTKTLEKCNEKNRIKKIMIANVASVSFFVVGLISYNYFHKSSLVEYANSSGIDNRFVINNDKKQEDKIINDNKDRENKVEEKNVEESKIAESADLQNSKINEKANEGQVKESNSKELNIIVGNQDSKEKIKSSETNNSNEIKINSKSSNEINNAGTENNSVFSTAATGRCLESSLSTTSQAITIEEAEELLNKKIVLPMYIPKGYSISSIQKLKDYNVTILIKYTLDLNYFYIKESKDEDNLNKNNENIKEGNVISWKNNGVIYSVWGNLSNDYIQKIAESIKKGQ